MNAIAATGAPLELEVDRLLNPSGFYAHPRDVLTDQSLSLVEKRAILSSWASDACAVESHPDLREVPGASRAIAFDDIMDALKALDDEDENPPRKSLWKRFTPRRTGGFSEGAAS
jgi:hypothetical protein